MSVTPNNVVAYGSADMPEADGVTVGGAVDFTKRIAFYDIAPAGFVDVVSSSSADTATEMRVTGRDSTGAVQTPAAVTLTGTTPVTGSQSFERLLAAVITGGAIGSLSNPGGTAAVGDVAVYAHTAVIAASTARAGSANTSGATPPLFALKTGDGASVALGQIIRIKSNTGVNQLRQIIATSGYGTDVVAVNRDWSTLPDATSTYDVYQGMLFEISPNSVVAITRAFSTAAADIPGGSSRTFYEKVFFVNNNTVTALTGVTTGAGGGIEIFSETPSLPGSALLDMALCTSLNDTNTTTNRQTAPASGAGSFVSQPAFISVPGAGNLPPGSAPNSAGAMGAWLRLTLPAGTAAYKGSADLRVLGATT